MPTVCHAALIWAPASAFIPLLHPVLEGILHFKHALLVAVESWHWLWREPENHQKYTYLPASTLPLWTSLRASAAKFLSVLCSEKHGTAREECATAHSAAHLTSSHSSSQFFTCICHVDPAVSCNALLQLTMLQLCVILPTPCPELLGACCGRTSMTPVPHFWAHPAATPQCLP